MFLKQKTSVLLLAALPVFAATTYPVSELYENGKKVSLRNDWINARGHNYYWTVSGIEPGEYSLQLKMELENRTYENILRFSFLYRNGKRVNFDSAGPVVYDGKKMYVTAQTPKIKLKNGDVIRIGKDYSGTVKGLTLSKTPLPFAPLKLYHETNLIRQEDTTWNFNGSSFDRNRLVLVLNNETGSPRKIKLSVRISDYFQNPVGGEETDVTVNRNWKKSYSYPTGNSDQYRAVVHLSDDLGNKWEKRFTLQNDCAAGFRKKIWLNSDWMIADAKDDFSLKTRTIQPTPPKNAVWKKTGLPASYKTHIAWMKRDFKIPKAFQGKRYLLRFEQLSQEAEIFLNGKKIAFKSIEQQVPFSLDITKNVNLNGNNTLFFAMRGPAANYTKEELKRKNIVYRQTNIGHFWTPQLIGEIYLETLPEVSIGNVKIQTSLQNREIKVSVETPANHTAENRVLFQGREVVKPFADSVKWQNPILWGPTEFPLLQLETTLRDSNGKIVDRKNTRFGFREFRADGMTFLWNGKPYRGVSRMGYNAQRISSQAALDFLTSLKRFGSSIQVHIYAGKGYIDFTDELGILCKRGSWVISADQPTSDLIKSDKYWKIKYRADLDMVNAFYNHPSIFDWYISNEFWIINSEFSAKRTAASIRNILKLDPTRFIEAGSDSDCRGVSNIMSTHYPINGLIASQHTNPPGMYYWRNIAKPFRKGDKIPNGQLKMIGNAHGDSLLTWGIKPITVNETGWNQGHRFPNGPTALFGDAAYTSFAMLEHMHHTINKHLFQGHRDAGVFCLTPWTMWDTSRYEYPELDLVVVQKYHHFYTGTKVKYDVNIFHDVPVKQNLDFYWKLTDSNGKNVAKGGRRLNADFCRTFREVISFTAGKPGNYTLAAGIRGKTEQTFPVSVSEKKTPVSASNLITAEMNLKDRKEELLKRAEKGETIVILAREDYPSWLPVQIRLTSRVPSLNFTFRPEHPVLKGIPEKDLSFWYPDHVTGKQYFDKPMNGNIRTIVEAGGPYGLVFAGLIEVPCGNGCFLFSRLTLDQEKNPIARKLLENMISYRSEPFGKLGVIAQANAGFIPYLTKYGVEMEFVKNWNLAPYKALIVDGGMKLSSSEMERLKNFKGTVIVRNPSPQFGVSTQDVKAKIWDGRALRTGFHKEMAGLNNYDYYYRSEPTSEGMDSFSNPAYLIGKTGTKEILGAEALVYPVYLAGKGNMLFDTFNWTADQPAIAGKAEHVITTILTNLGVKVTGKKKLEIPENLLFSPVDLKKYLNRDVKDDIDDDGKGGWSDQGPDSDMREFDLNPGIHTLAGADYRIERPKTLFALSSRYRKSGYPEVSIPVNRKFDWLFLLHSACWVSNLHHYSLFVNYEDGSAYEIKMTGKTNMKDWTGRNPGDTFTGEMDTVTKIACTVPQMRFKTASLFSTGWKNPEPEKTVTSITFKSMNRAVSLIVALSTATENKKEKKTPSEQEKKICREISEKGDALRRQGKLKEAISCYETALKADSSQLNLYKTLGACYEQLNDFENALKTYERSYKEDFNQPPILQLMKKMKEKLKNGK